MFFNERQTVFVARRVSSASVIFFIVSHCNQLHAQPYAFFRFKESINSIVNGGLTIFTLLFKYTTDIVKSSTSVYNYVLTNKRSLWQKNATGMPQI